LNFIADYGMDIGKILKISIILKIILLSQCFQMRWDSFSDKIISKCLKILLRDINPL